MSMSAPPNTDGAAADHAGQRGAMDRMYRFQRHIYDATRRFYLLGRERLIAELDVPPGGSVLEIGCGTGRNLILVARRYPNAVNVAVAAALAGPGLDATRIEVRHPGPVPRHRLALHATSAAGHLRVAVEPELGQGVHPVACSVIAALRREGTAVWVG